MFSTGLSASITVSDVTRVPTVGKSPTRLHNSYRECRIEWFVPSGNHLSGGISGKFLNHNNGLAVGTHKFTVSNDTGCISELIDEWSLAANYQYMEWCSWSNGIPTLGQAIEFIEIIILQQI
jgi:hypothetical protein